MLDNYNEWIRPRADLQYRLGRIGADVRQQGQRLDQLDFDYLQTSPSGIAPTGTGSTFMNHSHYFPGMPTPNRQLGNRPAYRERAR
jgi:hypothetical protein